MAGSSLTRAGELLLSLRSEGGVPGVFAAVSMRKRCSEISFRIRRSSPDKSTDEQPQNAFEQYPDPNYTKKNVLF